MKIQVNVECSPQEARAFLGLPDLGPIHDLYLQKMQQFVDEGLAPADLEKILRSWMPLMEGGYETWSRAMMSAMTGGMMGEKRD